MSKLYVAGLAVAAGLIIAFSQVFRTDANVPIFFGGVVLMIFGMIAFGDERAAR